MPHLGVLEDAVDGVDGAARKPGRLEAVHPVLRRLLARERGDDLDQLDAVLQTERVGGEARIGRKRRRAGTLAEPAELRVVVRAQDHVAIARREHLVRHGVGMRGAPAPRHRAREQVVQADVVEPAHLDVQQRDVDVLAVAGAIAVPERAEDRDPRVQPAHDVVDGDADLDGRPVGLAGDAHDAARALRHQIVARPRGGRPVLAVAGDRAVHEVLKLGAQLRVGEPVIGEAADLEVFDQHIGVREQAPDERGALRCGEVDRDRALVAIGAQVVAALRRLRAARVAQERRPPRARLVIDAGPLDLEHVRAEVAQHLRAGRPGEDTAEIEDRDAVERPRRHRYALDAQQPPPAALTTVRLCLSGAASVARPAGLSSMSRFRT